MLATFQMLKSQMQLVATTLGITECSNGQCKFGEQLT